MLLSPPSRTARATRVGAVVPVVAAVVLTLTAPAASAATAVDSLQLTPGTSQTGSWESLQPSSTTGASFVVEDLPDDGALYLALEVAGRSSQAGYRARVKVQPDGSLEVGTSKVVGGRESDYETSPAEGRISAGDTVNLQADFRDADEGDVSVRAWPADEAVPQWQHEYQDGGSPAVVGDEYSRVWAYLSQAAGDTVDVETGPVVEPEAAAAGGEPGAQNTGVPAGTTLTDHWGDLVITTAGAHYDALDIHGFVEVKAPDVTITRSIVRGGVKTGNRGLVTVTDGAAKNFTIEDSELVPDHPSVWYDGLKGGEFTARRVNIHGTVDNVKIHGNHVRVEDSWLHDSHWFASDPNQGGTPTHNDGVQVLGGDDIVITGNSISGGSNAGMQVTQDWKAVTGLQFVDNWADGGTCTVKLNHKGRSSLAKVVVADNRFGTDTTYSDCAILATSATDVRASGNVWEKTGLPVSVRRDG